APPRLPRRVRRIASTRGIAGRAADGQARPAGGAARSARDRQRRRAMSATTAAIEPAPPALGRFERWLSAWVALCIVAGIGFGRLFPQAFATIGNAQVANVNLPVAGLVWLMIVPMLMKVDFAALREVGQHWKGT